MSENKTPIAQFNEWLRSKSIDPKLLTTDEAENLAEEFGKTKTIPNPKNKSKKIAKEMFIQAFFKTIYNRIKANNPSWHEVSKDVYETGKFISSAWTEFLFSSSGLLIPSDPQHKKHVEKAIEEGKTIPTKVLKDYPDLKNKKAMKKENSKEKNIFSPGDKIKRVDKTWKNEIITFMEVKKCDGDMCTFRSLYSTNPDGVATDLLIKNYLYGNLDKAEKVSDKEWTKLLSLVEKPKTKSVKKKPTVKIGDDEFDCDDLAERERKQLANRRKTTAKSSKKRESTKNVEKVEKATDLVEKSIEKRKDQGKTVSLTEVETMIGSTKGLIRKLEGLLKKAS
jgi:hypothetical protein